MCNGCLLAPFVVFCLALSPTLFLSHPHVFPRVLTLTESKRCACNDSTDFSGINVSSLSPLSLSLPHCLGDDHVTISAESRREFKDLKDAARERLAVAHAQEKEKTLTRLRRSLGRGTGHSVSGLRGELWEEAHDKRTRCNKPI